MKTLILLITLFTSVSFLSYSQDQNQDFEKKNYYELKSRAKYLEVNNKYQLQEDTVFYSNSGFLVHSEWDEAVIDGKNYVILTYPGYNTTYTVKTVTTKNAAGEDVKKKVKTMSKPAGVSSTTTAVKLAAGQAAVNYPINGVATKKALNGKILAILKDDFDKIEKQPLFSVSFDRWANYRISSGQLTVPFKLRPGVSGQNFQMTTDVTIGAYGGVRKRISKRSPTYLIVPVVLGLTFINVNENSTATTVTGDINPGVTPGVTWSTGLVLQLNQFNAGVVLGRDYASGYAKEWIYHNRTWYSFAIGYSFVD